MIAPAVPRLGDVAPLTDLLKWGAIGASTLGLFVLTWSLASDPSSLAYRYYVRYTSMLERKLRPMFIFTPGRVIALGQALVAFLVLLMHVLFTVDLWWAVILLVAIAPTIYIEIQRRKRVEKIEEQLDGFVLALANALKTTPLLSAIGLQDFIRAADTAGQNTKRYFAFFLVAMPVIGLIETPKPLPRSITDAVLGNDAPAAAKA